jgi:hypothetical protein
MRHLGIDAGTVWKALPLLRIKDLQDCEVTWPEEPFHAERCKLITISP